MMKTKQGDSPLQINISFKKLFDSYRLMLDSDSALVRSRAERVLAIAKEYPELTEGFTSKKKLNEYKDQIDLILEDLFPSILEENEIKMASIPFQELIFKSSKRYKNIIKAAGKDFKIELIDFDDQNFFIMCCSVILNFYFGYKTDFRRPFYYNIPDENGLVRSYKALFNGDYLEIEKTEHAKDITEDDYLELLENFDNVEIWKKKFPPNSWISKGFIIVNLYDATMDVSLSKFKENLLSNESRDENFVTEFRSIIQGIFNLPNIDVGYTIYNEYTKSFERTSWLTNVISYLLNEADEELSTVSLCSRSYTHLFEKQQFYSLPDITRYHKRYPKNVLYKKLYDQGILSAIITPIVVSGKVHGMLEIVSKKARELNSINANKLLDIMPFLVDSVIRTKEKIRNDLELIIQRECTSIHPSVHWKFNQEALRFYNGMANKEDMVFREVVFDAVYPLYGQIDIKGSSEARNIATKQDLLMELKLVKKIIKDIYKTEPLPIYEQMEHRIGIFLKDIEDHLQVDSERNVMHFLKEEILPLFIHLKKKNSRYADLVNEYESLVDPVKSIVYKHRKDYDESVMLINKSMATILDEQQIEAQIMYPHYFERFKTDGVEHSLYIGESITKDESFNMIYLYNLRLWQLQVMCEMENKYYQLKETLPIPLNVASMILVFGNSLALRFRMDEKRFDVDGTYNARYEVIKKRVDKANIKGTDERITQPGKISIIYSQEDDEREYLKYINFLQYKKQLGDDLEILEVEDLQGVTGLKAIRVNILYNLDQKDKAYYTYEDLMKEIGS